MANLSIGCYKSRSENKDLHRESLPSWSFPIKTIAFCWCSGDCLKWLPAEWSQLPGKSSAALISLPWKCIALLLWEEPVSGLERAHASVPLGIRGSFVSAQLFFFEGKGTEFKCTGLSVVLNKCSQSSTTLYTWPTVGGAHGLGKSVLHYHMILCQDEGLTSHTPHY